MTLHITESGGTGNSVIFGEAPDASDGQDHYDLPEPPAPPQFPFILSWFDTSFMVPFNNLLQEYKNSFSDSAVWNLSILWMPAPGNSTTTTITIQWDSDEVIASDLYSLLFYENNTVVADMSITDSYSFPTNGALHSFQIISHSAARNTAEPMDLPLLPLTMGMILVVILLLAVAFIISQRKKK